MAVSNTILIVVFGIATLWSAYEVHDEIYDDDLENSFIEDPRVAFILMIVFGTATAALVVSGL